MILEAVQRSLGVAKRAANGAGCIFRPTYTDRKGVLKTANTWWYKLPDGTKGKCEGATTEEEANVFLVGITGPIDPSHGMSDTPEFYAYHAAKQRCTNPKHPNYKRYGARGIKFLFENFEQWLVELGPRPKDMESVDRIKNNENYEPGNVRWATRKMQQNNRRNSRKRGVLS